MLFEHISFTSKIFLGLILFHSGLFFATNKLYCLAFESHNSLILIFAPFNFESQFFSQK